LYGTFPKFFGTYVRDKKIMSWQEGVKRVTSDSAKRLGMKGKGLIREGYDADLVVFAPEEIQDEENYMNSAIQPKGISHVLVDGRVVLEDGKTKNPGSGKFIFKV
jgi:N-acyl-D-amino-acid deacylase